MKKYLLLNVTDDEKYVTIGMAPDSTVNYTGDSAGVAITDQASAEISLLAPIDVGVIKGHSVRGIELDHNAFYTVSINGEFIPYYMNPDDMVTCFSTLENSQIKLIIAPESPTIDPLFVYEGTIDRFDPTYWRVDGPSTASFAITNYEGGFKVDFISRVSTDLVGVVWDTADTKDHKFLRYATNTDYSGVIWSFDLELSETMPEIDSATLAPTLTIEYLDSLGRKSIGYVALKNYVTKTEDGVHSITLDFDNLRGGYGMDSIVEVKNVTKLFFSAYANSYSREYFVLPETTTGYMIVKNMKHSGAANSGTLKMSRMVVDTHNVGMSTSYDDHYDLNPARIVKNLESLGFRGFLNHYCGMSHYPNFDWDAEAGRFYIPADAEEILVNIATTNWHYAFATALKEAGMTPVFSVSWELYSQAAREEWCQREYDDSIGRTGYEPPSYFMSMCNEEAIAYIHGVYYEFAEVLKYTGNKVIMQIGEPWHWINTASSKPCVYDYATRLKFNEDTGLYAPDLGTIYEALEKVGSPYDEFKDWLRALLGQTCQDIRSMLKSEFGADTQVCPLVFFPSIKTHTPSLATYINYPVEHYSYPNFDFIMTEAYDWIMEKTPRLDLTHDAVRQIPTVELGYPPEKVAYLSGFVPDKMIAYIYGLNYTTNYRAPIWQRIYGDMLNNSPAGIMKQHVWAYPQVMEDSITTAGDGFFFGGTYYPPITDNTPYPEEIFSGEIGPYVPEAITKPNQIVIKRSDIGDLKITWNTDNRYEGISYEVQLLNEFGQYSVYTARTTTEELFINVLDLEASGLGDVQSYKIIVIPASGEASDIVDISPNPTEDFVDTVLYVAGQSHAAAMFTAMSVTEETPYNGAMVMREAYAKELGVHPATVKPVLIGWGSSAIDKLAQVDSSIDDTNYWYDAATDTDGPRLTQALEIMDANAHIPNQRLYWTQGSADADANAIGGVFSSTIDIYKANTTKVLNKLLAKLKAGTKVYWQLVNRKFAGEHPLEINGLSRKAYREAQLEMIAANDKYELATWTPGAEAATGYINESGFRAHYVPTIYQSVAEEVAKVLAGTQTVSSIRPNWFDYGAVENIEIEHVGEDISTNWTTGEWATFDVQQINVLTGDAIYTRNVTSGPDIFTAAEQRALYEYTAGSVVTRVVGYDIYNVPGLITEIRKSF